MMKNNPLAAGLFAALLWAPSTPAPAGAVTLEDKTLFVAFDANSGALTRLEYKPNHWVMERRPELGVSFRLFAPLPERRYNPVLGQKQVAAQIKKRSDHELALQWRNLVSENGGALALSLTADVTLTNGVLTFAGTLDNQSSLTVETVDYPYFGDFNPPAREALLEVRTLGAGGLKNLQADEVYPHFRNEKGYWGVTYPTKMLDAQPGLFCLLQAAGQGLFCEIDSASDADRVQYTFEQHPGVVSGVNNLVPPTDEFSGFPVHLEFRFCHFLFAPPHSRTPLASVVLRGYQGDWHAGAELFPQRRPPLPH